MCRVNLGNRVFENCFRLARKYPIVLFDVLLIDIFCTFSAFVFYLVASPSEITDIFTLRHFRNKRAT